MTTFNTFKGNNNSFKNLIMKNEQILLGNGPINSQKENLGFSYKNFWNMDTKNSGSPKSYNKLSFPSKIFDTTKSGSSKLLAKSNKQLSK